MGRRTLNELASVNRNNISIIYFDFVVIWCIIKCEQNCIRLTKQSWTQSEALTLLGHSMQKLWSIEVALKTVYISNDRTLSCCYFYFKIFHSPHVQGALKFCSILSNHSILGSDKLFIFSINLLPSTCYRKPITTSRAFSAELGKIFPTSTGKLREVAIGPHLSIYGAEIL